MSNSPTTQTCNVLVIGAGGAGLSAAIEARTKGLSVIVCGKRHREDAHTVLAAGGINAAFGNVDKQDCWQQHFADTYIERYGIGEPEIIELMAKESPQCVREIDKWGANFAKTESGDIDQRFFGAHTYRRTCYSGDYTGQSILRTLVNKANALMKIGEFSAALNSYSAAISIDPKIPEALHFIDALACNQSKKPPPGYVEKLFDNYASSFEKSLVIDLGYKIPDIAANLIRKADPYESSISVLDLGCGTGLFGEKVSDLCKRLDGVDASYSMLMEAQKKDAYDDLKHSDIEEYLAKNIIEFDYFVANDVFIYLGDLDNLFGLIKEKNKSGGKLLFTIELNNSDTFQLEKTGRYSHSREYIQLVSDKHGFCVLHSEDLNIRKETEGAVLGVLYILTF